MNSATDDRIGLAATSFKSQKIYFSFFSMFYSYVHEPKTQCLNMPIFYLGGKYLTTVHLQ